MKNKFIGFYNPTKKEIDFAWKNGIFAFDANSLLNLYRYTDSTRIDFLRALQTIKNKLFLPFQAAYEYHNNRLEVIEGIENAYQNLHDIVSENFDKIVKNQINQFKKHPSILVEDIIKLNDDFLKMLSKELDKQKSKHPDFKTKDDILDELTDLFDNSVGDEFSKDDLIKIYKDGETRYLNEIPPGYKDLANKQKKGPRYIYGDLIIWKELINYAKTKKQPLVFITDDRKEDWWTIQKGKTIRPREELIKEFFDITGIRILIYNADSFLSYAKEKGLLPKLKDETIEEVKDIRVSDEKYYTKLSDILSTQSLASKSILDMLSDQAYKPLNVSDLLGAQALASKSISDMLSAQAYKPISVSDLLSSQKLASKSISDMLNAQSLASKNISDLLGSSSKKTESPKKAGKKSKSQDDEEK